MENKMTKVDCKIIPIPLDVEFFEGTVKVPAAIYTERAEWKHVTEVFCDAVKKIYYTDVKEEKGGIEIVFDAALAKDAYSIRIDDTVKIFASDSEGATYGAVSVLQLAKFGDFGTGELEFEKINIFDKPDKDYRGLMTDLAREWHPFEEVLKFVDLCYFFKVKYLHLHIMDDQGYVLPSKAFPELSRQGKTYTLEQIKELCEYAKKREVTLIPEIEMPGHLTILNDKYPELFSDKLDGEGASMVVDTGAIMSAKTVLCAGSQVAFDSIMKIVDEVVEMFGDIKLLHLGGDEVVTAAWEDCSVCQEYIKKNGLSGVEELYAEFLGRATNHVLNKGITPIVWEGFSKEYSHYISKDVIVIAWETMYQTPQSLLEEGFKIINCSWKPLYLVPLFHVPRKCDEWGIKEILDWNVYEWQNWWEATESGMNPIHIQPTENLLGAQVCSWCITYEEEVGMMVRFLAATMERTWSVRRFRNYETFAKHFREQSMKVFRFII